jgi:hypothetical protein
MKNAFPTKVQEAKDASSSRTRLSDGNKYMQSPFVPRVQTKITFNRGGNWSTLEAPEVNVHGKKIDCKKSKGCSLHLKSYSSRDLPAPYSQESAVGIIMGIGNIGSYLKDRADELNTYLSRDGGQTWFEVMEGPHIFEFGDHGGLIVMADNTKATKEIKYTSDEGLTWYSMPIAN